jgi:hypothetical protein
MGEKTNIYFSLFWKLVLTEPVSDKGLLPGL